MRDIPNGQFGPLYPELPSVKKYRRAGKITTEYGEAVLKAIRTLNTTAATRPLSGPSHCPCASGTWHSDGRKILKAMRDQAAARVAADWPPLWLPIGINLNDRMKLERAEHAAYKAAMKVKREFLS